MSSVATSFSPGSGVVGRAVTITGSNFTSPATVTFNGAAAYVSSLTPTSILVYVPVDASTGPVVVTSHGTKTTMGSYRVTLGLLAAPAYGPPGTVVSQLFGSGFAPNEPVDLYLGTTSLGFVPSNAKGNFKTSVTIPTSARPGYAQLAAVGRKSLTATQIPFSVRTDWPQFGGGAAHSGFNPTENSLGVDTVGDIGPAWRVAGGSDSAPAVVAGTVYTYTGGVLSTYNAQNGAPGWRYSTGGTSYGLSPAVSGDTVVVSSSAGIFAVSTAGKLKWSLPADGTYGTPVISGQTVVVNANYVGDGTLALDLATGRFIWGEIGPPFEDGSYVLKPVTIANGLVFQGGERTLSALSLADGHDVWGSDVPGTFQDGTPFSYANGRLYTRNGNSVYAVSAGDGTEIWHRELDAYVAADFAVTSRRLVVATVDGKISALDTATGTTIWTVSPDGANAKGGGSLMVANGVVYGDSANGYSDYALNAATGATLWKIRARYQPHGTTPVVVNGTLYESQGEDGLTAYTLAGGRTVN